jgi:menaquinone-dependent protoporphyrinogen oxidase
MARARRTAARAPHVLVLFGTTEGHSARVAAAFGETLQGEGCAVEVVDAAAGSPEAGAFDAVIVVASVHAGDYQSEVMRWTRRHARTLNAIPSAFVSVSLGVLQDDPKVQAESQAIRDRFVERTGWTPAATLPVAGALQYSRYNFVKRLLMQRIAAQAGGDTDTRRDYDYTDWKALAAFARRFAKRVKTARAAATPAA